MIMNRCSRAIASHGNDGIKTVLFNRQQSGMPEFRLRQQKTIAPPTNSIAPPMDSIAPPTESELLPLVSTVGFCHPIK
ncbi:MAG: hypothetical protein WBI06_06035 [Paludibacter sp.]